MDLKLKNKIALVTASTRGLGRGCAEQLAAEGCKVAICSRNQEEATQAASEISNRTGSRVIGFAADMSNPDEINGLVESVRADLGDPEILVTNAGGPAPGTFATTPLDQYEKGINLNLMSAVRLIHAVVPVMQKKGWGRIIAITSTSVKQPIGTLLLSNTARAGLTGFLKTIATELAPDGITVNAILPGIHKTDRILQLAEYRGKEENRPPEEIIGEMMNANPTKTIGDPENFGAMAAFLASDQACFINGQSILIDGGSFPGLM
ncbi:MAG: SDR family oxidoreductase [Desulfobacterales bacterium]|nr:SDR family oxidoreductase [Desulfobacterales bacterium]